MLVLEYPMGAISRAAKRNRIFLHRSQIIMNSQHPALYKTLFNLLDSYQRKKERKKLGNDKALKSKSNNKNEDC